MQVVEVSQPAVDGVRTTPNPAELPFTLRRGLLDAPAAAAWFAHLQHAVAWQDHYDARGRRVALPRAQAWFADRDVASRYSRNLLTRHDWTPGLSALKTSIEAVTGKGFNALLLTCYRDGHDHVDLHADDDDELGPRPWIASLSLGASRRFGFRRRDGADAAELPLHSGDLLLMPPRFQRDWLHGVPVAPDVRAARINLTFRRVCAT